MRFWRMTFAELTDFFLAQWALLWRMWFLGAKMCVNLFGVFSLCCVNLQSIPPTPYRSDHPDQGSLPGIFFFPPFFLNTLMCWSLRDAKWDKSSNLTVSCLMNRGAALACWKPRESGGFFSPRHLETTGATPTGVTRAMDDSGIIRRRRLQVRTPFKNKQRAAVCHGNILWINAHI